MGTDTGKLRITSGEGMGLLPSECRAHWEVPFSVNAASKTFVSLAWIIQMNYYNPKEHFIYTWEINFLLQ